MIYEYQCQECKAIQEVWHKLSEENIEPCTECKAPPEKLRRCPAAVKPHVSWSKWKV